ncbi:acyl-CoA dehydrogenase family protein [Actinomadura sp. WMMB 499]|uniref:acyl-CoA dehydrogenase family protein n=1 Tax=Actinomadura sp. WMMB 499 TaxID=1219491 RepID=UPI001249143F|nr:acyl-CoA dehydrogenase family protein [Actinomadura sp. WMMB 499]QFG20749.1 acyl-CoA dehydrogenase [Actinomadura sp. WMMB 499]
MSESQKGAAAVVRRAHEIADGVLFPAANAVDATGEVPEGHWDLLAREGFYGLAAAVGAKELGFEDIVEILEVMSGGCLSTTFTWMQHQGAVLNLSGSGNTALRERHLQDMVDGRTRAGVAFAGVLPNPPKLWARAVDGGYELDGEAPFVSGWGVVDVLHVSGRDPDSGEEGTIVSGLIDAVSGGGLGVEPIRLVAGQATSTVRLTFDKYLMPSERVTGSTSYAEFLSFQAFGSRLNGCVACGITRRAVRLLDEAGHAEAAGALTTRLDRVRADLDAGLGDPAAMTAARAAAAELALKAAGAVVAGVGSSGILAGRHAERLVREATFALVAASRPDMRADLVRRLTS